MSASSALKHQVISIHSVDVGSINVDQFHSKLSYFFSTKL